MCISRYLLIYLCICICICISFYIYVFAYLQIFTSAIICIECTYRLHIYTSEVGYENKLSVSDLASAEEIGKRIGAAAPQRAMLEFLVKL